MTHTANRTSFAGTAYLHGSGGKELPFAYEGSYSRPHLDRQGCLRFGWTARVEGLDRQPAPRTTVIHEAARELAPDFVERRIQRSIEEHLSACMTKAPAKMS